MNYVLIQTGGIILKKDKKFYINLFLLIFALVLIVAGVLTAVLSKNYRFSVVGYVLLIFGLYFLFLFLIRILAQQNINKEKRQADLKALAEKQARDNLIAEALNQFNNTTDYPETNTVKLTKAGIEFFVKGRYVCKKDFKNVQGYHLAFEIDSTELKFMPKDYDDVCDLRDNGILISIGYLDGEALEVFSNENGIILQTTLENSVGKTVLLKPDEGYITNVWTVEGDEIDYGFIKILKYENDVLTVHFLLNIPWGLCDIVEGVVELKKDNGEKARDIDSLIDRIRRKPYNVIEVSAEEVQTIKNDNPFLPESYIKFLSKVGFADLDWIDVGRNYKTPNNLTDDETKFMKDVLAERKEYDPNDFYFIAVDNDSGYYALSKKPNDKKVYCFLYEGPYVSIQNVSTYETFEEFLAEIIYL